MAKAHGVTQKEIAAVITHVAFYAGWPKQNQWYSQLVSQAVEITGIFIFFLQLPF